MCKYAQTLCFITKYAGERIMKARVCEGQLRKPCRTVYKRRFVLVFFRFSSEIFMKMLDRAFFV